MTDNRFFNRSELIGILLLAVFLVVVLPLTLDVFRLNLVAKYLTYAFVALGLVVCWGYGGIGRENSQQIEVQCLDSNAVLERIIQKHGKIDVLKIDTNRDGIDIDS